MSVSLRDLMPELQPWAQSLVDAAGGAGLMPQVTSTRRSNADQVRLYRRAQAGLSPYPAARPGTSAHEYGWAFDMVVTPMAALADVGWLWESWGGVWGGHPKRSGSRYDPVHFEWPDWRALVDWNSPDQRAVADQPRPGDPDFPEWWKYAKTAGSDFAPGGSIPFNVVENIVKSPARVKRVLSGESSYFSELVQSIEDLF